MIQIITEKKDWDAELAQFGNLDFYHSYDYHHLSKSEDESPILIKYTEDESLILLPLLIRAIDDSSYKDAISVYGYAGLLSLNLGDNFNKENFHLSLNSFFIENKIISVFSRLHPFLDYQEQFLDGLGSIVTLGKVIYIDLKDSLEEQLTKYNRRLKTYLNKSRKACTVIDADKNHHIETFIHLYHENMKRVGADDKYFFDEAYYYKILSSSDFDSELKLCIDNETQTIIGAAIFMKKGDMVQYHLSGISVDHFDLNPIKLIIDEMRIQSSKEGFKYFNLGGGIGNQEDSLFRFKSRFSKDVKEFKLWKYIVNPEVYNELVARHFENYPEVNINDVEFFPAYRAKLEAMPKDSSL